jgi:hypothetical protein
LFVTYLHTDVFGFTGLDIVFKALSNWSNQDPIWEAICQNMVATRNSIHY